jgi:hypothetical protein
MWGDEPKRHGKVKGKNSVNQFCVEINQNHSFVLIHVSGPHKLNWRSPFLVEMKVEMERIQTRN